AATSIAKGPAIAMRRVNSVTRVILRWFGVEQCRTLGVLREQTEFAAHTEFYSSERAHKKATSCRGRGRPHPRPEKWGTRGAWSGLPLAKACELQIGTLVEPRARTSDDLAPIWPNPRGSARRTLPACRPPARRRSSQSGP